jgi:Tol biopolymer transport system component
VTRLRPFRQTVERWRSAGKATGAPIFTCSALWRVTGRKENHKRSLDNVSNIGAAWTPDGRDLIFASQTGSSSGLWRIPAWNSAKPRRLAFASDNAYTPSISRQGNRLAYVVGRYDTNIWRVGLLDPGRKPGNPVPFISSTKPDLYPSFSLDGKRIAYISERSGSREIWICDADGSNSVQLTSLGATVLYGPRWSSDGADIGFAAVLGQQHVYLVSAKGGKPRRLTAWSAEDDWPYWSRDGRWIYFSFDRSGRNEVWRMPSKGGEAVQITRNEADIAQESPDGRFIYYSKGWPLQTSLWRISVEGGEEVKFAGAFFSASERCVKTTTENSRPASDRCLPI